MMMTEDAQDRRPLEITVVSAKELEKVNLVTKMDVYAAVSIKGDPCSIQEQKTNVDKDCGPKPTWNFPMKFSLDEAALQQNDLTLKFQIISKRILGDKEIGEVHVPIKKLLDREAAGDGKEPKNVSYDVWSASGKVKGTLNFAYKFGDKYDGPPPVEAEKVQASAMAYLPAGYQGVSSATHPHAPGGCEAPPPPGANPYPPPGTYPKPSQYAHGGYPTPPRPLGANPYPPPGAYSEPPQYAHGGYPPQPVPGYGYPGYPPQPGNGGYPPLVQAQQPPKDHGLWNVVGAGDKILSLGLIVGKIWQLDNDADNSPDSGM